MHIHLQVADTTTHAFVALNNLGMPTEPTSDGPHWAFADGNAALEPYGRRLTWTSLTDLSSPGDFVIYRKGNFEAYRSKGTSGILYPCKRFKPTNYNEAKDSASMVRELRDIGDGFVLKLVLIEAESSHTHTSKCVKLDFCGGTTDNPSIMPTRASL